MNRADELRKVTEKWSNGATMMAINEEIQIAQTDKERLELLIFKSEVQEFSTYGSIHKIDKS